MIRTDHALGIVLLLVLTAIIAGCGGAMLLAYTGGGLPPGEPDLGGIVVASVEGEQSTAQWSDTAQGDVPPGTEPVRGAQVTLMCGQRVVGRTTTGQGGYFRFEAPDTGNYTITVTPPAGSDLRGTQRQVTHIRGRRTFVTIQLERIAPQPQPGAGLSR